MYILGIRLDNLNLEEALNKIREFLHDGHQHYIVLPYADFLVQAQKDAGFKRILNESDLSLSDGVGPVLASRIITASERLCGRACPQRQQAGLLGGRVMGVDLIWALFAKFGAEHSIFLFGAKDGVAQEMARNIFQKAPEAKIVGMINGYVSDEKAIDEINDRKPEILLVALGMPKQEKWIYDNLKKMPSVKLAIGVGGAFDFISGRVRRAPNFIQQIGMEWLWRLLSQPNQWRKTWRSVVIFSIMIFRELISKRKKI